MPNSLSKFIFVDFRFHTSIMITGVILLTSDFALRHDNWCNGASLRPLVYYPVLLFHLQEKAAASTAGEKEATHALHRTGRGG